eukprot:4047546-Alexandrium_andersonii.AAC.1
MSPGGRSAPGRSWSRPPRCPPCRKKGREQPASWAGAPRRADDAPPPTPRSSTCPASAAQTLSRPTPGRLLRRARR